MLPQCKISTFPFFPFPYHTNARSEDIRTNSCDDTEDGDLPINDDDGVGGADPAPPPPPPPPRLFPDCEAPKADAAGYGEWMGTDNGVCRDCDADELRWSALDDLRRLLSCASLLLVGMYRRFDDTSPSLLARSTMSSNSLSVIFGVPGYSCSSSSSSSTSPESATMVNPPSTLLRLPRRGLPWCANGVFPAKGVIGWPLFPKQLLLIE